ncbi:MAG: hypothetical protein R3F02_21990 [Thiolinea sp.]
MSSTGWLTGIGVGLWIMPVLLLSAEQQEAATNESLSEIYQRVFGEQAALPAEMETELRLLGKRIGNVQVKTDGKQVTQLPRSVVMLNLQTYLKTSLYEKLQQQTGSQDWLTTQQLENSGINVMYNSMELTTDIKIEPKLLNRRMRSVLSAMAGRGSVIPENLAEPAKLSAYANFFTSLSHTQQSGRGSQSHTQGNIRMDGAINFSGYVLEHQYTFRAGGSEGSEMTREYTRLVVDDVENERRYHLGDLNVPTRNQQSSPALAGISVSHDRDWPTAQVFRPQGNYRFKLDADAEVKVYQDGELTNTVQLTAGEHTLEDVQATQGLEIELHIRDEFGKESIQRFSRFTDSRLLHPDVSRYAFSVGIPASYRDGKLHYDTRRTIASGFYQTGLTETLTAGVDVQTDGQAWQVGTDAIWATRIGNISAAFTQTQNRAGQRGQAIRFQISNPQRVSKEDSFYPINWSASASHFSRYFSPFSVSDNGEVIKPGTTALQWQANLSLSKQLFEHTHASLGVSRAAYFDGRSSDYVSLGLNQQVGKNLRLSVNARQQRNIDGEKDTSFRVGLSIPLDNTDSGRSQSLSSHYDSRSASTRADYRLGRGKGRYGRDSLSGSVSLANQDDQQSLSTYSSLSMPRFDGSAALNITQQSKRTRTRLNLNASSALVFADGAVAVSRQVSDSFAILDAPASLEYPMAVKRGKSLFSRDSNDLNDLPKSYDSVIQPGGKAVLGNLSAYSVQHISTDSAVLPDGGDLNATEFDLLPDYKSGYRLKPGGVAGERLQITLRDQRGNLLPLQGGQLVPADAAAADTPTLFFTDESGVTELAGLRPGRYRMELFSRPGGQPLTIEVAESVGETRQLELQVQ